MCSSDLKGCRRVPLFMPLLVVLCSFWSYYAVSVGRERRYERAQGDRIRKGEENDAFGSRGKTVGSTANSTIKNIDFSNNLLNDILSVNIRLIVIS